MTVKLGMLRQSTEYLGNKIDVMTLAVEETSRRETPYALGTTKAQVSYNGVAFVTKSKNKILQGTEKNISFKVSPADAEIHEYFLALEVVGNLRLPYSYTDSFSSDDHSSMTMRSYSTSNVVIDLICVRLINSRTNATILEIN